MLVAEGAEVLKAAVPTAWVVRDKVAYALVMYPDEVEPGEWWTERWWGVRPWVFSNGIFAVEVVIDEARFAAVACPQYSDALAEVEEVHILLNTEPVVGLRLHPSVAEWVAGWALALRELKKTAVERARQVKFCRF